MERGVFRGNLDEKQRAVFQQVLEGKKGREIAQSLQISPTEVEKIVRRTCHQLGVTSRMDAARKMAAHYRWTTQSRLNEVDRRSGPARQFAGVRRHNGATVGKAANEAKTDVSCLQDISSFNAMRPDRFEIWGRFLDLFGTEANEVANGHFKRILLIALLVVGSTMALSALVSAMQGFDVLMS